MLKMNVSNMCKEVHRVRVLYVHVFVSVYNFLRWNKIIKYKKNKKQKGNMLLRTKLLLLQVWRET